MPAWAGRLDPATLKALAVYVHSLGGGNSAAIRDQLKVLRQIKATATQPGHMRRGKLPVLTSVPHADPDRCDAYGCLHHPR